MHKATDSKIHNGLGKCFPTELSKKLCIFPKIFDTQEIIVDIYMLRSTILMIYTTTILMIRFNLPCNLSSINNLTNKCYWCSFLHFFLLAQPQDLYRVCESYKPCDANWALQTKAVVDRIRLALADKAEYYQKKIQPSVQYLGRLLSVDKGAVC